MGILPMRGTGILPVAGHQRFMRGRGRPYADAFSAGGVDFDSLDGKPTKIFFLILAPSDKGAEVYLALLSELIGLVQKPAELEKLCGVTDYESLIALLGG